MSQSLTSKQSKLILDDQVVKVYAKEIDSLVADVVEVLVIDDAGIQRWPSADAGCPPPSAKSSVQCDAPRKHALTGSRHAFDFPLLHESADTLILRVVVQSLDPPSLSYVSDAISSILECLLRQIRLDTTLTTTCLGIDADSLVPPLSMRLQDINPSGDRDQDLQALVDMGQREAGVSRCIVYVPASGIDKHSPSKGSGNAFMRKLVAKLMEEQKQRRRPISMKLKLPSGETRHAVCAPIRLSQRSVDGVVVLLMRDQQSSRSVLARTISSRVTALIQDVRPDSEVGSRHDLLKAAASAMDGNAVQSHSLLYLDIDKMHTINDAFGYSFGDRVLRRCKQILADCRGARDTVAHLGSDRFALFLPGASLDTAMAKGDQILRFYAQETINDGNKSIALSASIGVACSESTSKGAEDLLILAEVAARGARERGGGQIASYQDVDNSIIQRRSDVDKVGFLQTALIQDQFTLHAQRILPINAENVNKFELLARLADRTIDNGSAAQFLAAAERYQMMSALDRWVVNSALQSLAQAENLLEVGLSTFCINVSAQSLADETFVDHIESRIAETGVPPDTLCFEITETSLVRFIDRAQSFISRLQRLGCSIALDDFGTGYSSFGYLKTLPIDVLKIDGSFVRDIMDCALSRTIVSSVVRMAEDIGAQTVAEHVENDLVRATLKDLGVHFVQGFGIHKPEPIQNVLSDFERGLDSDESCVIDMRSDTLELMVKESRK